MSHAYYQLPNGRVASIDGDCDFPPLSQALTEPNGLIAIGGDLSFSRLLSAYQQGIFPWFSEGDPIMWWSPSPRMVLYPDELNISRSLAKTLKNSPFEIRFNTVFREVISACSNTERGGQLGTWITEEIINAYCALHDAGHAISAECWLDNQLVGGCYGVKIGNMFYGESMFHLVSNASKVAFVKLVEKLKGEGIGLIDCQMKTAHLASFGAREIERDDFIKQLSMLIKNV
ncbi:leucyl/phenylalanyl-tRNA--protein transferase [Methylotenera sp.]|uniref:leucyl/phenylalanyl-tRNA--protein transferase n=1 Tax=Methylotenera sp. TaxID=2051956 RepID=UPI002723CAE1|nr:leucyl/phenylalanyl-tRNA--protein transferase [Methylotenera sp.]MDO9393268.1 leucyl/phenylalanyl-tRNA--protein transferase [Methylotenera sp.]MDP2072047.1 leucyl/phenylalanyl-tRNA--protein transferase [Methylotenera sp.]MDP2230632.1 leucyl/phenylalanyl-tRNA--protein transferase [Methylotenera sp.]MDP3006944.1 leucyl/phenylalanyl-tRNA--protein transferase [Methylotenera sp.]MDP3007119.1 leucyl/phenylalanyl-tRNA--protein transferase [Methylotenera sp.]